MIPSAGVIGFLCGHFSGQIQGLNITLVPPGQIYTCSMSKKTAKNRPTRCKQMTTELRQAKFKVHRSRSWRNAAMA